MVNVKEKDSECKENLEEEKADTTRSKIDCQMTKDRSSKEDWLKVVCQWVHERLCEDDWPKIVCQRVNKRLYEED